MKASTKAALGFSLQAGAFAFLAFGIPAALIGHKNCKYYQDARDKAQEKIDKVRTNLEFKLMATKGYPRKATLEETAIARKIKSSLQQLIENDRELSARLRSVENDLSICEESEQRGYEAGVVTTAAVGALIVGLYAFGKRGGWD